MGIKSAKILAEENMSSEINHLLENRCKISIPSFAFGTNGC